MYQAFKFRHGMACAGFIAVSCMTLISNLATAATGEPHPQSAVGESLQAPKKSYIGQISDRLSSLDLKAKVKLIDVDLIDGLKAALDYKYEVEPSYDGEYHLRMDRGTLDLDMNVAELFGKNSRYVGLKLNHGTELLYVRPYKSKSEAMKALPYGLTEVPSSGADILARLPLTAKNTIENLGVGDFFSFTAEMNIIVGASSLPLSVSTPGFFSTHYLISGQFQIHIYKATDNKVRLKLIAVRKSEKEVGFVAGFGTGHKIFGLKVLDRRIEKALNITEMFQVSMATMKSNLLMVDYMMDLSDSRVSSAYDGLISSILEFKTLSIGDPRKANDELTNRLISDITPLETIYANEALKPTASRVVDRLFKGKNDVDVADRSKFKFAPIVFNFSKNTEYFENMLTSTNPDESLNYYRLHTYQRTNSMSWWFSYYKSVSVSRASLLFDSDASHKIGDIRDIVFEWNYRDKSLTKSELRMIKEAVKQAVPDSVQNRINWGSFNNEQEYNNARFIYKMVLNPKSLSTLQSMNSGAIYGLLEKYIQTIPTPISENQDYASTPEQMTSTKMTVVDKYKASLLNIAHYMAKVVNTRLSNLERSNAFAELRFNSLFIEIGPGFLVSLLPQTDLEKFVNFEVSMVADNANPMTFNFGNIQDRKVYEAASYIESVLTANEFETITQMMNTTKAK